MAHQLRYSRFALLGTMQRLRTLPVPLKIAAIAAAVLAVAAGMGVVAALTLGTNGGPPEGAKTEQTGQYNPEQGGRPEDVAEKAASDGPTSEAAYLDGVADIQNGSVEAFLRSNDKLLRYDGLTAEDIEELKADYAALENYARRARDLTPPAEHENQYKVFVLAINELRDANELAYRLAADPSSATQTDFEAYDRHVNRATAFLRRSNEMLGEDYKVGGAAQEISLR
jgi:hypothetical protein